MVKRLSQDVEEAFFQLSLPIYEYNITDKTSVRFFQAVLPEKGEQEIGKGPIPSKAEDETPVYEDLPFC